MILSVRFTLVAAMMTMYCMSRHDRHGRADNMSVTMAAARGAAADVPV